MLLDRIRLPFEDELRAERFRLIETLSGLSDDDFDAGTTLCSEWAPRDVLGHVIGLDYFLTSYLPFGPKVNDANQAQADRARAVSRDRLMEWARHWADQPSTTSRIAAPILLGDLGVHHQDVLRGLGLTRNVPDGTASAIFREGLQLSMFLNRRVLRHRLEPTDGHHPVALPSAKNGPTVRGTREALGMWLCGRDSVTDELEFA